MKFQRKNRCDVQVYFKGWMTRGLQSRSDVEQTPESVIEALTEFIAEIKRSNRLYQKRLRQIQRDPVLRAKAIKAGVLTADGQITSRGERTTT
jgi:hypothetical protein